MLGLLQVQLNKDSFPSQTLQHHRGATNELGEMKHCTWGGLDLNPSALKFTNWCLPFWLHCQSACYFKSVDSRFISF